MENFEQVKVNNKYPGPVAAGFFFSLTTIFMVYSPYILKPFKNKWLMSGMGEVLLILLPALIFLVVGGFNLKETLKLRKTKPLNYVIVFFLMCVGIPVVGVLNAIFLGIIKLIFGKTLLEPPITISDVPTLLIAFLVIGVSAAVCEEVLFRGLVSKGYEGMGYVASLICTSVLFGILHRDIQKAVSTILLGALIGFIVYRTKSIFTGMLAHFTNNAIVVCLSFTTTRLSDRMKELGVRQNNIDWETIPKASLVFVAIFYFLIFLGFISFFVALSYALIRSTEKDLKAIRVTEVTNMKKPDITAYLAVAPGLVFIALTFTGQFLKLMDINSGLLYEFLRTIRIF